jgi:hypothetical protein
MLLTEWKCALKRRLTRCFTQLLVPTSINNQQKIEQIIKAKD